jgi:hypothetical protein
MPGNPFMSREDWKQEKVKYGIPDKVVKSGSFGEKMGQFRKQFETGGFSHMTAPKIPAALALVKAANTVFDEWLAGATKLKPEAFKGDKANKDKAIARVKWYKGLVGNLENQVKATKDPFISARMNRDKCWDAYKKAVAAPDDANKIAVLYSQGIRNWLGAPFHGALDTYKGDAAVVKLLKDYEQVAAKWNKLQKGTAGVAADPSERKTFFADMQLAMRIGDKILAMTKP